MKNENNSTIQERHLYLGVVLTISWLAAGCGSKPVPDLPPPDLAEVRTGASFTVARPTEVNPANVSLVDLDDAGLALMAKPDAGRFLLVNIWATWCEPCIEEFPSIVRLKRKYESRLDVRFISADFAEDRDTVVRFLAEQEVDWKSYFFTGSQNGLLYSLTDRWSGSLPATFIYRPSGELAGFWSGFRHYEDFESAVHEAMTSTGEED